MVNTKTEQIYCDLSELVGGAKSRIVSSKVKFEERGKNEETVYERQLKSEAEKKQTLKSQIEASNLSFNIAGRSVKSLPRPMFNNGYQDGIIIVDVEVNPEGKVIAAKINSKTSINNASMKQSCLDVALKTEFSSLNLSENQSGSITYSCKLD